MINIKINFKKKIIIDMKAENEKTTMSLNWINTKWYDQHIIKLD